MIATLSKPIVQPESLSPLAPITLRELLRGIAETHSEQKVNDLTIDSREVRAGSVFVALRGTRAHGLLHAAAAIEAGAEAVLYDVADRSLMGECTPADALIGIENLRVRAGEIADRFFGSPSSAMRIAGVTGTNGKTTVAYLIAAALSLSGRKTGYAGTLGFGPVNAIHSGSLTTPDCITVHRRLRELLEAGHKSVAMEVSSHALDQQRVAGVHFDIAVFTNLTRDHLDYHGTEAAYMAAKARLFQWPRLRDAVINVDDVCGRRLVDTLPANVDLIETSVRGAIAQVRSRALWATHIRPLPQGLEIEIGGSWGEGVLRSSLIGDFNAENLLSVLAVLLAWGLALPRALQLLELCSAPPGRMERLGGDHGPIVVVDYAHTPDALDKALLAARRHCAGRLICVFGCGGDRDRGKRALMGAVAEQRADEVYVTDDNPRSEPSAQIIDEILAGIRHRDAVQVQPDRAIAIRTAIAAARSGDIVVIAGKGHEDYQIVGTEVRAFSDREVACAALRAAQ